MPSQKWKTEFKYIAPKELQPQESTGRGYMSLRDILQSIPTGCQEVNISQLVSLWLYMVLKKWTSKDVGEVCESSKIISTQEVRKKQVQLFASSVAVREAMNFL